MTATKPTTPAPEPVRSATETGWLSPTQVSAYLAEVFGRKVGVRSVQSWCRRARNPLPHAQLGSRLLIHKAALDAWLGIVGGELSR